MAALPDVNFWLALAWEKHDGHRGARTWWEAARNERIYFCRVTQMALLRLLTNHSVMKSAPKSQAEAWRIYDDLRGSPRVEWVAEPGGFEAKWRQLSSRPSASSGRWTDDYLAGVAILLNLRLVTFDAGFKDYPGLQLELLTMPAAPVAPTS